MAKIQKFFCEFCKAEVPQNAGVCPGCGRKFSAVRCPKCGKTGSHEKFNNGCPFCGYAAKRDAPAKPAIILDSPGNRASPKSFVWIFYVAAVAALGVFAILLFVF
ncbi:MAG: hypothetical protein LBS97_06260 [Treponema sp.]|jgi:predicted amidophosphoribosyltransferase|nr:hypothetical protein [Treponema sp.]